MKKILFILFFLLAYVVSVQAQCLNVSVNATNFVCDGLPLGTIEAIPTNGTSPYTFDWSTNVNRTSTTGDTLDQLAAGTYVVTITDAVGCDTIITTIINGPTSQPTINSNNICNPCPTFTVGNTQGWQAPFSYQWFLDNTPVSGAIGSTFTLCQSGYLTCQITAANGCIAFTNGYAYGSISAVTPSITASKTILCQGECTDITVGTNRNAYPLDYKLINNTGNIIASANGIFSNNHVFNICPDTSDAYFVEVVDSNGCADSIHNVTIVVIKELTAQVSTTNINCHGSSTGLIAINPTTGAAPYTFNWSTSIGQISNTGDTLQQLPAGSYTVTITDAVGCDTLVINSIITEPSIPFSATVTGTSTCTSCQPLSINTTGGTGPYTYQWYLNGVAIIGATNSTHNACQAGAYYSEIVDGLGCVVLSNVLNYTPNFSITPAISSTAIHLCEHDCVDISATSNSGPAPFTYELYNTTGNLIATAISASNHTFNICPDSTDNYFVRVINSNGCADSTAVISLTISKPYISQINVTNACPNTNNGTISVIPSSGVTPYMYNWGFGANTHTVSGLPTGTYCCTVTDFVGCSIDTCVTIGSIPLVDQTIINPSLDPFGAGHCEDGASINLGVVLGNGSILVDNGTFSGAGVRQGNLGANGAVFYPDSAVLDMGHTGEVQIAYEYTTPSGCTDIDTFVTYVHAKPDFSFVNLPAELCTEAHTMQIRVTNNVTTGSTGQQNYVDTIPVGAGIFAVKDINGNTVPNVIQLFDNLTPTSLIGYSKVYVTYQHTVSNALGGCSAILRDSIVIKDLDVSITKPAPPFSSSYHLFLGSSLQLPTQSNYPTQTSYSWTPSASLSCNNCPQPLASPSAQTTYYLNATLPNGCSVQDSVEIITFNPVVSTPIHLQVSPNDTLDYCTTLAPFISGTAGTSTGNSTANYGSINTTTYGCFDYLSNGTNPEVVDTITWVNCEQLCDTIVLYVTTASCVWPGDTNSDSITNNFDILPIGLHHGATGYTRYNASINYTCQPSRNWGTNISNIPTVDLKHVDANGNGIINSLDTNAIIQNWAQTHLKSITNHPSGVNITIDTATTNPGDTVNLDIILGNNLVPTTGYGLAFTIRYDLTGVDSSNIALDFSNSWLGTIGSDLIAIYKNFPQTGVIEVGLTRIDQISVTGGGPVAQLQCIIKDDVLPKSLYRRLSFEIENVRFIDEMGMPLLTNAVSGGVLVQNIGLSVPTIDNNHSQIAIYPNPTNGFLNIISQKGIIKAIRLMNTKGSIVVNQTFDKHNVSLNINNLATGIYFLQVQTDQGLENIKLIKN